MYGPTGNGEKRDGLLDAGQPGSPLPPRPQRAAANNATRVRGICDIPDDACTGETDMVTDVPWMD